MKLPQARVGDSVKVRGRLVEFSLWPVRRARGGFALNPRLFVANPWPVMTQVVNKLRTREAKEAGAAFLEQARDFFQAAISANTASAKPLLLYYCLLNLAKALILVRLPGTSLDVATHGLSEKLKPSGKEMLDAYLEAKPTGPRPAVFGLLLQAICGTGLTKPLRIDVPTLMRQIVTGHRLFVASAQNATENFLALGRLEMLHDPNARHLWLRIGIASGDLRRLGIGQVRLLQLSRLGGTWRTVTEPVGAPSVHTWFELVTPLEYQKGWIANSITPLVKWIRPHIWQTVLSVPPYRAYYLFLPPIAEQPYVLPPILSAYALFFYYGSITRYRPHHFDRILEGNYGAFTEGFLHDQPSQLLFLFASEFACREVARAAIV